MGKDEEDEFDSDNGDGIDDLDEQVKVKRTGVKVPYLDEQTKGDLDKKTLVLDMDETLIHTEFFREKPFDFSIDDQYFVS